MTVNDPVAAKGPAKTALITGITGQDGAWLVRLLLKKGYQVHGIKRRTSLFNTQRIDALYQDPHIPDNRFFMHFGDMTDTSSLIRILQLAQPDEIYNLAAQSHVQVSFELPEYTADADALGALRLLEAVRTLGMTDRVRVYQSSSSEIYGGMSTALLNEESPFEPRSPYAAAKLYAYWLTVNYRKAYSLYAVNGILFNHESAVRGETFVTRKITRTVAKIELGREQCLYLGNLNAIRDWGHAKDYVRGMWLMLQQPVAEDYVLASGRAESVRFFVERSFAEIGITIRWQGQGVDEQGIDRSTGKVLVRIDPRHFRPLEVDHLLGDASKAQRQLGWQPTITLEELISEMVAEDLRRCKGPNEPYML